MTKTRAEDRDGEAGIATTTGGTAMYLTNEDQLPPKVATVSREELRKYVQCKRVGNYLLGKTVGEGSFAKVKEAFHILTGEKVAIKVIDKNRARKDRYVSKNMRREARLLQMIRHPHIVQLLEIVETSQCYYLVFEFADGGDLMDHICKHSKLEEEEVRKFIRQIISAVQYLHHLGIIHSHFRLGSHRPESFPQLQVALNEMEDLVEKKTINEWEMKHVEAIRYQAEGYPVKSIDIWEEMVLSNPYDALSLRMLNIFTITCGCISKAKKVLDKIIPLWKPDMALYGYVQGMYAFCLNESHCYEEAEKYALKGLELNPCDCWSTHARVHIMDNTNRAKDGIEFMEKTENDWKTGTFLLEHNYWHFALFYVDKGDFESALSVFDDHLLSHCTPGGSFGALRDGISLLYRLQLEGVPTRQRWQELNSFWYPSEHASIFNDVHMMMSHLGAKDYDSANSLLESCNEFLRQGKGTNWEVTKEVGLSLCEALMAFDKEQYDDAVELLMPVRDDIIKIGGSDSQRDLFNQLLIHSAICSSKENYRGLGKKLVEARKKTLGETGVTRRLEEQLLKQHGET